MKDIALLSYLTIAAAVAFGAWYSGCEPEDTAAIGIAWPLAVAFEMAIRVGQALEEIRQ